MSASKIMVIRHAEKPGKYDGVQYAGVNNLGTVAGEDGAKHLVTLGWERAGALVTLFAPPWGPKAPLLATPQFLFASDPNAAHDDDTSDEGPSQRPFETLSPLAAKLCLPIDTKHRKNYYAQMVKSALACDGTVLIAWQHQDIALTTGAGGPGISQEILKQTGTTETFNIPTSWPTSPGGGARYDLVFVFDRPTGNGPIIGFDLVSQNLLPGDEGPMADVKLPLVEPTTTVAEAISKMRAAGVSGIIERSDEGAWLFQAETLFLQVHHRPNATMGELIGGHWLHQSEEEHRRDPAYGHYGVLMEFRGDAVVVGGLPDDLVRDLALAVRWYLCDKDPANHQYSPAQYRALPVVNGTRFCSTKDGGVVS